MSEAATHHDEGKGQYFWVWAALLVITVVEIVLAYKQVLDPPDRKSTRLNSSHSRASRMPSSA